MRCLTAFFGYALYLSYPSLCVAKADDLPALVHKLLYDV